MKKLMSLFVITLVVCTLTTGAYAASAEDMPQEVLQAAENGVAGVKSVLTSDPGMWGFANSGEIEELTLGQGYHVNFVGQAQVETASGNSISELIDPGIIDTWQFTLDLDGTPRVFLTVAFEDGMYRIVRYGGDARNFGDARNSLVALTRGNELAIHDELLKVSGRYYFYTTGENEFLLPVQFATEGRRARDVGLISAAEFTQQLQDYISTQTAGIRGNIFTPTSTNTTDSHAVIVVIAVLALGSGILIVCLKAGRHAVGN